MFGPYESDLGLWGKLLGDLKCFRESLDCCHSGRDTTIKLSSEFIHSSGGQDQLLTYYNLVNKHSRSDSCINAYISKCFHSFNHLILTLLLNGHLTKLLVLLGVLVTSNSRQQADTDSPTNCIPTHRLVIAPDVVTPNPCLCLERVKVIKKNQPSFLYQISSYIYFFLHPLSPSYTHTQQRNALW